MAKKITVCGIKVPAFSVNLEHAFGGRRRVRTAQVSAPSARKLATAFGHSMLRQGSDGALPLCAGVTLQIYGQNRDARRRAFVIEKDAASAPFAGAKRKPAKRRR